MVLTRTSPSQFTLVSSAHHDTVYNDFEDTGSGKYVNLDAQLLASIRHHHQGMTVTIVPSSYADLAGYAAAGYAHAELDTSEDSLLRWRFYRPASTRGEQGQLADAYFFARYKYTWMEVEFIVYTVQEGLITLNYILFPPDDDESLLSHSKVTDALLQAVGDVQFAVQQIILVYDGYWRRSRALYKEVQKASWDDVILDEKMKKTLTETVARFFDSKKSYKDLDVPWKRGIIFYGPAGNGKTISIKALMHTLSVRDDPIVSLYVKAIHFTFQISAVFQMARQMAPCLLILEDIDTLVTEQLRSYFFNEVDGLENNDGIMMIATTNHLDRLDGGLAKRPSRFDRKYAFPVPDRDERILYCEYWRRKLQNNKKIEFPEQLSSAIADITEDFTFAYLKEAFVASLLALVRGDDGDEDEVDQLTLNLEGIHPGFKGKPINDEKDIANLPLWIEIQKQVKLLREDMDSSDKQSKTNVFSVVPPFVGQMPMQLVEHQNGCAAFAPESVVQDRLVEMRASFNQNTAKIMPVLEKDRFMQMGISRREKRG